VAWTTAVIAAVLVAETVMSPAALSSAEIARALTSIGVTPPYSAQPIRLRASENPMAMPGVVPLRPPPIATASAVTRASIPAVMAVVMPSVPPASSFEEVTVALV
jgi:hypothetical protein